MSASEPFVLFDDARADGSPARLYRDPIAVIRADFRDEVRPALERLRQETRGGRHAAGYIAYEAGFALDAALLDYWRDSPGPLLWFGLFDGCDLLDARALQAWLTDPDGAWVGSPRPHIDCEQYLNCAARARDHLFAGDFYQVNFTFGCDVPMLGPPLAAFAKLRRFAGAGWGGVVRHADGWILSFSPEQFFTIRNGTIETRPMKGTARRRADPAADAAEAIRLAADAKQRAENLMIVDLLRNDLARVAETGTVEVPELFAVETYPTVHQMVSRITARVRDGLDAVDVLEAMFPCGSVTGAPKISAMRHLAQLEREPRGAYTGSMGWIEPGGDAAFNVLIRTLEMTDESGPPRLGLGSGLVVDSIAGDEWRECLLKGEFVSRAAEMPDLIETMRFDPEEGVVELDRHFDRLRRSAEALGFHFDHHSARNELQAATFGKKREAVARLLLSPTGKMAIEIRPMDEVPEEQVEVALRPLPVDPADYRLRFKTTDRRFYDQARQDSGAFEVVFTDPEGFVTEGSFTTVFLERDGILLTPPLSRGVLPGILRSKLIEEGRATEADLRPLDLSQRFFIGNMVRGLIAARLA